MSISFSSTATATATATAASFRSLLPSLHHHHHHHHINFTLINPASPSPRPTSLYYSYSSSYRHPPPLPNLIFAVNDDTFTATTQDIQLEKTFEVKKRAAEISDVLKGTSIFIVGMKSNIKASMSKFLAEALRYYYFDSDELVEDAAGVQAGGRSFKETDEEGFRSSETEVLKQLSSMGRLVVSAGDGAVQSATNLALLRYGISVCIDSPLEIVANNVMESLGEGSASEMDGDHVISQLFIQYNENKSGYENSDVTISLQKVALDLGYNDLELVTEEDLALAVIKEIEKLTRVKKLLEEAARPF